METQLTIFGCIVFVAENPISYHLFYTIGHLPYSGHWSGTLSALSGMGSASRIPILHIHDPVRDNRGLEKGRKQREGRGRKNGRGKQRRETNCYLSGVCLCLSHTRRVAGITALLLTSAHGKVSMNTPI